LEKFESGPILLPSGRQTQFFPAGIIADVASAWSMPPLLARCTALARASSATA
jgi:hypothetical protein